MNTKVFEFENIKNIGRIYDKIWFIAILIAVGLIVMQLVSGNLNNTAQTEEAIEDFPCEQTKPQNVEILDTTEFKTVSELSSIEIDEDLYQTSLGKNSIPAIFNPKFSTSELLADCLDESSELLVLSSDNTIKAYPLKILEQHLLVNDFIEEQPVLISYCALCGTYNVYSRAVQGEELPFGVSGFLYKNNDLIFDNKTESLWSQYTGEALVGSYLGTILSPVDYELLTFKELQANYPSAEVLNFDTGFVRNYNQDLFANFQNIETLIMQPENKSEKLAAKELIIAFKLGDEIYAVSTEKLDENGSYVIDDLAEQTVTVTYNTQMFSVATGEQKLQAWLSYWYVLFDFYPEVVVL